MRAASSEAYTGLRYETIQAAKNAGCRAFKKNNSVDCDILLAWLKDDHPEILDIFEKLPNQASEEAWKTRAERRTKEAFFLKQISALIPADQVRRAFNAIAKQYVGRAIALKQRLHITHGIALETLDPEIAAIIEPLSEKSLQETLKDVARNAK